MSDHPIVHIEISANDREATARFYEAVFGWKTQQIPEMNYATFDSGKVGGGFSPVSETNPAGSIFFHILTDDIEASLAQVESQDGKTVLSKTEIPGIGWYGLFNDPTGNLIGLYTPLPEG
jgi:uncharacterized protein